MWLLMILTLANAPQVHTWLDEQGVRHFSDQPQPHSQTLTLADANQLQFPKSSPAPNQAQAPVSSYQLQILAPESEATIRNAHGRVRVQTSVTPKLQKGHTLQLLFDGQPQDIGGKGLTLDNVDRGTHQLQLRVIDQQQRPLSLSQEQTLYLHRPSSQFPKIR